MQHLCYISRPSFAVNISSLRLTPRQQFLHIYLNLLSVHPRLSHLSERFLCAGYPLFVRPFQSLLIYRNLAQPLPLLCPVPGTSCNLCDL